MDLADIAKEDSMLGSWPRRLLHIPSMTSYEWQPGNKYGPHTNLTYNAITYTWGRWRLLASQQPSVTPIKITGIPCEVPRVDPAHFTANQLEAVLLKVQTGAMTAYKKKRVLIDFVWLDIACIDQRESERRSAAEVGRQAKIFHGAHNVFIWFSQTSIMELNTIAKKLDESNEYLGGLSRRDTDKSQLPGMLGQLHQSMTQLFRDPWFSSLWTLQEAFLRQDAITSYEVAAGYIETLVFLLWKGSI